MVPGELRGRPSRDPLRNLEADYRADVPHRSTIKVRFYELDPYDHVNHSAYIQYFEVARVEVLDDIGTSLSRLRDMGYHLVVVEIRTRFVRSAGAGDELTVETSAAATRRTSTTWTQRLLRGDELLAEQETVIAATTREGRPTRLPPELVEALTGLGALNTE